MPTTLKDIASQLNLSVATISKALADSAEISPETKAKVFATAQALNYYPNLVAKGLRFQRTRTVGVVVDSIAGHFGSRLVAGIQDELLRCGYQMLLVGAAGRPDQERAAITTLLERAVDGLIMADTRLHSADELPPQVADTRLPTVFVNRRVVADGVDFVGPDNWYGGYLATEHLLAHGHRRIAHIAGPPPWAASTERVRGYQSALRDYGLPIEDTLVVQGNWSAESGETAGLSLLQLPVHPTAIFVANDQMAAGVFDAVRTLGLTVPDDVAIVGFDNLELTTYLRPTLTTVELPVYEMGVTAATFLVDRIAGRRQEPVTTLVRGRILYRASCGTHGDGF